MPRGKSSLLIILITALTVAALFALPYTPVRLVETAEVKRGDLLHTVLASGTVSYTSQQACVNLYPGVVRAVHVRMGEQVKAGQLLFSMDTSAQQNSLSALYQMKYEAEQGQSAAAALLVQQRWQQVQTEAELLQQVQAAQIRAQMDGIVENVYVSEDSYTDALSLLGSVRSEGKCVTVSARMTDCLHLSAGDAAVLERSGRTLGAASVTSIRAPEESGMQQLTLVPANPEQLDGCAVGERITAELVTGCVENIVLIPLSAVDEQKGVWYVEDGRAMCAIIDAAERNAVFVAAGEEWLGRRVILYPRSTQLQPGCRVKEAEGE